MHVEGGNDYDEQTSCTPSQKAHHRGYDEQNQLLARSNLIIRYDDHNVPSTPLKSPPSGRICHRSTYPYHAKVPIIDCLKSHKTLEGEC